MTQPQPTRILQSIYDESQRLCTEVGRRHDPHSFYILMALFTVENQAGHLLRLSGFSEDILLDHFPNDWGEREGALQRLQFDCTELAKRMGDDRVNSLHLLFALATDEEGRAREALQRSGAQIGVSLAKVLDRCERVLVRAQRGQSRVGHVPEAKAVHGGPRTRPPATRTLTPTPSEGEELKTLAPQWVEPERSKTPTLDQLCEDMSALALTGAISPIVGRQEELGKILDILGKRRSNNPVIVGPPGVGKTALVEGLAHALQESGDERRILGLDIGRLMAGTGLRGSLSDRLGRLRQEIQDSDQGIVLFIDEIHGLLGAGEGVNQEIAGELKAALARGQLPCIGATTEDEYRMVFAKDPALSRRFSPIFITEPSKEEAFLMLQGAASAYGCHHGLELPDPALRAAVDLSHRYLDEGQLPAKAFDLLDLAASRARRSGADALEVEAVASVVAERARMPIERLLGGDEEKLLKFEAELAERVVGHEDALQKIATTLRRNRAGFGGDKPIGSFLLLGPTGVGKTEVARATAEALFGRHDDMLRFDMGEFTEAHSVARLIGAPPGYVGHEEGGQLTEGIRRWPYRVLLFDEIEKGHPDVLQVLLALLDEGRVSDSRGFTVDARHCVVFLTSNLGARRVSQRSVGFGGGSRDVSADVLSEAKRKLPPEFFNRLDEVLAFEPLTPAEARAIAERMMEASLDRFHEHRRITVDVEDGVFDWLVEEGYSEADGARPMRRTVQNVLESALAEAVLKGELSDGGEAQLILGDEGPEVRCA
ncbi:MAG: AAA family ATPase [Myxococcales bacterium]|nr:AAA family ATPase [Myxococcales bacterium]